KKCKKAFLIVENDLVSLYLYVYRLMNLFLYIAKIEKDLTKINDSDLKTFNQIYYSQNIVRLKSTITINNEQRPGEIGKYDLDKEIPRYVNCINNTISKLKESPIASNLDLEIIEIVSTIEKNKFIRMAESYPKYKGSTIIGFSSGFLELIECIKKLDNHKFNKHRYRIREMTTEEIIDSKVRMIAIQFKEGIDKLFIDKTTSERPFLPNEISLDKLLTVMLGNYYLSKNINITLTEGTVDKKTHSWITIDDKTVDITANLINIDYERIYITDSSLNHLNFSISNSFSTDHIKELFAKFIKSNEYNYSLYNQLVSHVEGRLENH
ncbi:hypothetical protein, partial [Petrocella sp. FN5]|uniref:hypothetical protein n=1 Tax=Petrocella sp. FN5 TaxID=3032002 RepID=UPI0023DB9794